MATETVQLQVGDKVLFVRGYGQKPITTNVIKATRTGRIRIDPTLNSGLYIPPTYGDKYLPQGSTRYDHSEVYPYSIEKETELLANVNKKEANENIKRALQEAQQKEREERLAKELNEVKEAFLEKRPGLVRESLIDARSVFGEPDILPDGTRLYRVDLPIKGDMKDRKGGFEIAIVHCKDMLESDWESPMEGNPKIKKVSFASTYVRGVRQGDSYQSPEHRTVDPFPSISGGTAANDGEALWETARHLYHLW